VVQVPGCFQTHILSFSHFYADVFVTGLEEHMFGVSAEWVGAEGQNINLLLYPVALVALPINYFINNFQCLLENIIQHYRLLIL
jgi:hypothetical protein